MLSKKFTPQHNETILSLLCCKLLREEKASAEEWNLKIKANECKYRDGDRRLKEVFINRINDHEMITEIIQELTTIKKTKCNHKVSGVKLGKE